MDTKDYSVIAVATILIVATVSYFYKTETVLKEYRNYSQIKISEEYHKGWVSNLIPDDSEKIILSFNIDTNYRYLKYKSDLGYHLGKSRCQSLSKDELFASMQLIRMIDYWGEKENIFEENLELEVFVCNESNSNSLVLFNPRSNDAFIFSG